MILLSMNIQGMGAAHKKSAIHRLVSSLNVDVFCLRETVMASSVVIDSPKVTLRGWHFVTLDSVDRSGGLITK